LDWAKVTSSDQSYEVFVDYELSTTYSISQLPSCVGFSTVNFIAKLIASDGETQYNFETNVTTYTQCV
jgi:hypothetical protein